MSFNPKVKDFLEKNQSKTMIGFWWSITWRPMIIIFGIEVVLFIVTFSIIAIILSASR